MSEYPFSEDHTSFSIELNDIYRINVDAADVNQHLWENYINEFTLDEIVAII